MIRLQWAGCAVPVWKTDAYRIFVRKRLGKRSFGLPWSKWEHDIIIDHNGDNVINEAST